MPHTIASREQWLTARAALLEREKEHTRLGDELARGRRELPWLAIEQRYTLQTAHGPKTLPELFDGRSQLLIYHFMFGSSYQSGCPVNSSIADSFDALIPHLNARDVTLIGVSGAPIERLEAYRRRMGWRFEWVSSSASQFNADLGFSTSAEQTRAAIEPILEQLPAVALPERPGGRHRYLRLPDRAVRVHRVGRWRPTERCFRRTRRQVAESSS